MLFGDRLGFLIAERVFAAFAHDIAPLVQQVPERALVGAVADEAVLVFDLDVVAFDKDRRQALGAVRQARRQGGLVGHPRVPVQPPS